ncbi:MAG: hypothetical protein EXR77_10360 [Myxococcales bacterium]|nr:hypothetical protein [Myxococcales bacterium]
MAWLPLFWAAGAAIVGLAAMPAQMPANAAANDRILAVLGRISETMTNSAYKPVLRVDERRGRYEFDCSAMAGWVLTRSAPRARSTVGPARPLARDFARTIAAADIVRPRKGWLRVPRMVDARPGDVLAWRRPPWFPSRNTGHVAFVMAKPVAFGRGLLVRIADATSIGHGRDSRAAGQTGFGIGVLWITVDAATGAGTGYGWVGEESARADYAIETPILIGRATR